MKNDSWDKNSSRFDNYWGDLDAELKQKQQVQTRRQQSSHVSMTSNKIDFMGVISGITSIANKYTDRKLQVWLTQGVANEIIYEALVSMDEMIRELAMLARNNPVGLCSPNDRVRKLITQARKKHEATIEEGSTEEFCTEKESD